MTLKWNSSWYRGRHPGFTLIEVVAGLSLMSITLVVCLVGIRRHEQQLNTAQQKLHAVRVADQLLEDLHQSGRVVSVTQSGLISSDGVEFAWRAVPVPAQELGLMKLRVTVGHPAPSKPLTTVEMLIPFPETPTRRGSQSP